MSYTSQTRVWIQDIIMAVINEVNKMCYFSKIFTDYLFYFYQPWFSLPSFWYLPHPNMLPGNQSLHFGVAILYLIVLKVQAVLSSQNIQHILYEVLNTFLQESVWSLGIRSTVTHFVNLVSHILFNRNLIERKCMHDLYTSIINFSNFLRLWILLLFLHSDFSHSVHILTSKSRWNTGSSMQEGKNGGKMWY